MKTYTRSFFIFALAIIISCPLYAGSQAGGEPQFSVDVTARFAKQIEKRVAEKGARVFIIGRVGRPISDMPEGFLYSHVGIGVYSAISTNDGRQLPGYAFYNLYQNTEKADASSLVTDYPLDFFAAVHELRAGIIIPTPDLQRRMLAIITSGTYKKLHNPQYSMIASPYNNRYQNCTEYVLDIINAAIYRTDNIDQLKLNARSYFEAQEVKTGGLTLLMGAIFMPDIRTSDHEQGIKTASFTTIGNYLNKYGLVQEQMTIVAD